MTTNEDRDESFSWWSVLVDKVQAEINEEVGPTDELVEWAALSLAVVGMKESGEEDVIHRLANSSYSFDLSVSPDLDSLTLTIRWQHGEPTVLTVDLSPLSPTNSAGRIEA